MRLRGGGAGRGIGGGRSRADLEEESEDTSSSSTNNSSSSDDDDEEEESGLNTRRGGDKENQPQSRRGGTSAKVQDDDVGEVPNQNGAEEEEEEEMEMEQDIPKADKDGSNLKVTLQKPPRAKQDSSAIVPKLEAVATSTIRNQSRTLIRPPIRNCVPRPDHHSNRHVPPQTRSGHTYSHSSHQERLEASKRSRPAKLSNGASSSSSSSSSELQHLRIPLSALQEGGAEADRESTGSSPSCEREVWVSVFRYLSRADLCVCMAVCKNWYKW